MRVTPEDLPAVPFEACSPAQAMPYTEYWAHYQTAYPEQKDAESRRRLTVAGSVLVREPDKFTGIPTGFDGVNGSSPVPKIIETWDRGLGSFNPLLGAEGDLLRGAAAILGHNQLGSNNDLPTVRVLEPKSVAESFLDVTDQMDIERQKPSHALLVGAQLVHKAALLNGDRSYQSDLFTAAETLYRRIDDTSVPGGPDKFRAAQYRDDIAFHNLSDELRQAGGKGKGNSEHRDKAVVLLRKSVRSLLEMYDLVTSNESWDMQCKLAGDMAEPFMSLVLRDTTFLRSRALASRLEVRTAFGSEDEPYEPKERKFDHKFDRVLTTVARDGRVLHAVPLQVKTGDGEKIHDRPYHPAIKVITLKGLGSDKMARAGRSLLRSYNDYQFNRIVEGLDLVLDPLQPILEPAMAAR
jgi:hypothetical protein